MTIPQRLRISPQEAGLNSKNTAALIERAGKEVREGLLPSAQIALARYGRLALLENFGTATDDSLFCVFSATKAITSAAAWLLWESGELHLDARVRDLVPEFSGGGKEDVLVEQLFTHTSGFPSAPFNPRIWKDQEKRHAKFASWRLNWPPGTRFEYHPSSSMHVVADIIERLSGMDYHAFVRHRISTPLGLDDLHVGLPEDLHDRVLPCEFVGEYLTSEDYQRLGVPEPPVTEVTEEAILAFNQPEIRAAGIAGGGGICGAADLALFYQALLHGGPYGGAPIWSSETLEGARRIRSGALEDPLYGIKANRALGLVIAGKEGPNFLGFGYHNSPQSFGHNGAGGQIAWADPVTGLSFAYCTSGHDRDSLRQGRRGVSLSNRAAVCSTD